VYGGLLIDLIGPLLLLGARTRPLAFAFMVAFHLLNTRLFSIGIFPWLMLLGTTVFFPTDWPRRVLRESWGEPSRTGTITILGAALGGFAALWFHRGAELIPFLAGAFSGALLARSTVGSLREADTVRVETDEQKALPGMTYPRLVVACLAAWALFQIAVPLRHFVIPGNVHWTEAGHRFAWHMKLRDKEASVRFVVTNPASGEELVVDPREDLTSWQYRKMATRPYMLRSYARHLAQRFERDGVPNVEVRARSEASLNSRPRQTFIDPDVDLAKVPFSFGHDPWVLPLVPLGATAADDEP